MPSGADIARARRTLDNLPMEYQVRQQLVNDDPVSKLRYDTLQADAEYLRLSQQQRDWSDAYREHRDIRDAFAENLRRKYPVGSIPTAPFVTTIEKASLKVVKEKQDRTDPKTGKVTTRGVPVAYEVYYGTDKNGDPILKETFKDEKSAKAEVQRLDALEKITEHTEGWLNLALKQIVLMATNEGFDRVAFVDGQTSADRYDLSKKVDSIEVQPIPAGEVSRSVRINLAEVDDAIDVEVSPDGIMSVVQGGRYGEATDSLEGKPLEDAVGKELAEKIMGVSGDPVVLEGEDLKVGGRGMKKFYDEMVPQNAKKMVKKLGGKTTQTDVADLDNAFTIEVTPEMREAVAEGLPLFAREGEKKILGTAKFDPLDPNNEAIVNILLDPDAKPTTLMHELMHWNLEEMARMGLDIETRVSQEGYEATFAEAQMLADIQKLLKWSGFKGTLAEWSAMEVEDRRSFHEAVAVSFEKYLYEGVAPTAELRTIFDTLASYIRKMYEAIINLNADYRQEVGRDLPSLENGDIRAVFGRMMSAERDIEMYRDIHEAEAMSMDEWVMARTGTRLVGKDLNEDELAERAVLEEEWKEYNAEFLDSINEAKVKLTMERMKEVGYQMRARQRINAEINKERRAAQKQIKSEVEAELQLLPVFQLRSHIRDNKYQTENGENVGLPTPAGETRRLNKEQAKALIKDPVALKSISHLLAKDGLPFEVSVDWFGFDSVEDLAQQLSESGTFKQAVEKEVDLRMLNEHSDLTDPVLIEERIQSAVHNKTRERVVARELRALLNNGTNTQDEVRLMRALAKEMIRTKPNGEINIIEYNRAAVRARKKSLLALRKGDMEAAVFAKRQEMLNEAMMIEGQKARNEVRKLVRLNKAIFKARSDVKLAKSRDISIVKALRAVLSEFGIGRVVEDVDSALSDLANNHPEYSEEVRERVVSFRMLAAETPGPEAGNRRVKLERLTVEDIRSLYSLANEMWKHSRSVRQFQLGERKQALEDVGAEAMSSLSKIKVAETEGFWSRIQNSFTNLRRIEHLFRRIDLGKEGGIWTRMFRAIKDAGNSYRDDLMLFMSKKGFNFEGKLKDLDLKMPGGERSISRTFGDRTVKFGGGSLSAKSQIIHLAMHFYGNRSNREKLVAGYSDGTNNAEVDLAVGQFLNEMVQTGILTKKDFDFMQSVFDKLSSDDMLGRAQSVMRKLRGTGFEAIKSSSFNITLPNGEVLKYAGGYIPIKFNKKEMPGSTSTAQAEQIELNKMLTADMVGYLPISTPAKFAEERQKTTYELDLGLAQISQHAAAVYRYINMAEPASNVDRVMRIRGMAEALNARFGEQTFATIESWIRRSALQRVGTPESVEIHNLIYFVSRSANMGIMFANVGNSIQNYAGLVIPMREVGVRRVLSALTQYVMTSRSGKKQIIQEITGKSKEMRTRLEQQIFDIYADQQKVLADTTSASAKAVDFAKRKAYFLQQYTQNQVDIAVWQAAYNKETEKALDDRLSEADAEKQAIAYADSLVRRTQMAGNPEDISMFEGSSKLSKALFPFKSWFINWMNNAATQGRIDLDKDGRAKVAELATSYVLMLMIPAVLAQLATEAARGNLDDEDDGIGDDMMSLFFYSQISQITGGIPGVAELTRTVEAFSDDKFWNNRFPSAPYVRALENVMRTAASTFKEPSMRGGVDLAGALGNIMGIPLEAITDRALIISDEMTGDLRSEGTYDMARAMVTARRSPSQRLR